MSKSDGMSDFNRAVKRFSGLKIDLHVHTHYSYDALITLKEVVTYSMKRGLDGVAITDHNTLNGALKLAKSTKLIIIPGIELSAKGGHILGLNVSTPIPPKLSFLETIRRIHEAGGIAVAAHPYIPYKSPSHQIGSCDAIEAVNSATVPFSICTYLSTKLAVHLNLPMTAGSDSHFAKEIGAAYTIIESDPDVDEIIQAIRRGVTLPQGKQIPPRVRLQRFALSLKRKCG